MRKLLLPLLVFALVLGSCKDDLTSLNENPKGATDVPADPLFSNALVSLGTLNTSVDYNINMFKFMSQYWAATTYADESQYNLSGRSIPSNYWSEIYRDVLNDLKESSALVAENELIPDAQKTVMQAQIEVMQVMAYHQLVTVFGDIPYTEALDADNPSPAYDDDATIYSDLMSRLNAAISDLNSGSSGFSAAADVYYDGNVGAWVKFANSLKMRMAIQLSDANAGAAQTAIEAASPNAFQSTGEQLALQFQSAQPHTNPVWEDVISTGRNDFVAANTLIEMMNNNDDPRRWIHFTTVDTTSDGTDNPRFQGGLYGASNGYVDFSHIQGPLIQPSFEGILLGYDEVEFIRAEAAARGWNVSGTAQSHYNEAITADMNYWSEAAQSGGIWEQEPTAAQKEIDQGEITTYLTNNPYPVAGSLPDQLKAIAEQKWVGLYMQGLQAWTDWRRLDHPTWNFAENPGADTEDDIPTRFIYPVDEQNLNESNWEAAASAIGGDETSTLLFWDADYASSVN
ncbi:SusD/RagB family nutrient-binding outer membrane lipoprotein [Fodinibius sp.]|uniref:SusD/RagB family nutrient-binding outer membrane lipoprotein n=1 Tax=Fodinibius sp. TaxID=1872440 RepID=UPI002ACDD39F|nr:SusD/RagB family nutrient-binding outer membrane lipoprotein [Fodinibius sp.]MDZ7659542.1 SusD/RagB family nutrient-binding outer membrane lipoprotein [Fodinibius sp.]